jgi:hypothetical protein
MRMTTKEAFVKVLPVHGVAPAFRVALDLQAREPA